MRLAKLALVATSPLVVRSAAAQPEPPTDRQQAVLPAQLSTSTGVTLDGRLDYVRLTESSDPPTLLAFKLHGQYVATQGVGGYASLPFVYASGNGDSETYAGNLELGGLYVLRRANMDVYLRGGATLELGSQNDADALAVPITNFTPNPADAVTTGLGTSWLRGGGAVRLTSGSVVFGGSGGLDIALSDGPENLLHLTGVIGLVQPGFGVAVGATIVQALDGDGRDNNLIGFQAIGDGQISAKLRLYGALGLNFEEGSEGFSLGAGVRAGL